MLIAVGILTGISGLLEMWFVGKLLGEDTESYIQMLPDYPQKILYLLSEIPDIPGATDVLVVLLLFMPGVLLVVAGQAIAKRGRRHVARTYEADNPHAIEAPILYLRPFVADGYMAALTPSYTLGLFNPLLDKRDRALWRLKIIDGMLRYEELLAYAFRRVGVVVAIGDPKEHLPLLGSTRIYAATPGSAESVDDETWRMAVERQIEKAQIILLHIGLSDGLRWEVNRVVELADPHRVVLCVNREQKRGLSFKMILRGVRSAEIHAIQEMWSQFRKNFEAIFPHGLPETLGEARFIKFDSDWTPRPLETAKRKLVWFLPGPNPDLSRKTIDSTFAWLTWILVPEKLRRTFARNIVNVVSLVVCIWLVVMLVGSILLMGLHLIGPVIDLLR